MIQMMPHTHNLLNGSIFDFTMLIQVKHVLLTLPHYLLCNWFQSRTFRKDSFFEQKISNLFYWHSASIMFWSKQQKHSSIRKIKPLLQIQKAIIYNKGFFQEIVFSTFSFKSLFVSRCRIWDRLKARSFLKLKKPFK